MPTYVHANVDAKSKITCFYHDPALFEAGSGLGHLTIRDGEAELSLHAKPDQLLAFARNLLAKATELAERADVVHMSTVADPDLAAALLWRDGR